MLMVANEKHHVQPDDEKRRRYDGDTSDRHSGELIYTANTATERSTRWTRRSSRFSKDAAESLL